MELWIALGFKIWIHLGFGIGLFILETLTPYKGKLFKNLEALGYVKAFYWPRQYFFLKIFLHCTFIYLLLEILCMT